MRAYERAATGLCPDRERPAATLVAKGEVAKAQQPMGYHHVGKLGPILLTAANLHKELAQLLILERVPGCRPPPGPSGPSPSPAWRCGQRVGEDESDVLRRGLEKVVKRP